MEKTLIIDGLNFVSAPHEVLHDMYRHVLEKSQVRPRVLLNIPDIATDTLINSNVKQSESTSYLADEKVSVVHRVLCESLGSRW